MGKVLIIEDDAHIRKFLRISLVASGFLVREARLGEEGLACCAEFAPDLVILDLGLPDIDGRKVLGRLREWSQVPVIVLSVRADVTEKVDALNAGANDYVTKPFSITELVARLRVLLRTSAVDRRDQPVLRCGDVAIDRVARRVQRAGEELHLSRKEYALLHLLLTHAGQVLTHRQILQEIWGPAHADDTHYLRVLVGHLRQKLGDQPTKPRYIHTVQGVGYRFSEA